MVGNARRSSSVDLVEHPLQPAVDLLVKAVDAPDLLHDLLLVDPVVGDLLPALALARLLLVRLEVAGVGVLLGEGGVVLAVVAPVLVSEGRAGAVPRVGRLVVAQAVLCPEVDLLGLLERLLVLVLAAGGMGAALRAALDHGLRGDPAARLVAVVVAGEVVARGVVVEEGVVEGGALVEGRGGGGVVVGRAGVGVGVGDVARDEAVEVLALRVDVVLEAPLAGFEHSYRQTILEQSAITRRPPQHDEPPVPPLRDLAEPRHLQEALPALLRQKRFDLLKVRGPPEQAAEVLDPWVAEAVLVESEEEGVLPTLDVMLLPLHRRQRPRLLLEERRVAHHHRHLLSFSDDWVQDGLQPLNWPRQSQVNHRLQLVALHEPSGALEGALVGLDGYEGPAEERPPEEGVDEGGPGAHVEHAPSLGQLQGQPEEVVDPRRDPGAEIARRTRPLQAEDVGHDSAGERDEAALRGEVPDDAVVEDEDVLAERGVEEGELVEVDVEVVEELESLILLVHSNKNYKNQSEVALLLARTVLLLVVRLRSSLRPQLLPQLQQKLFLLRGHFRGERADAVIGLNVHAVLEELGEGAAGGRAHQGEEELPLLGRKVDLCVSEVGSGEVGLEGALVIAVAGVAAAVPARELGCVLLGLGEKLAFCIQVTETKDVLVVEHAREGVSRHPDRLCPAEAQPLEDQLAVRPEARLREPLVEGQQQDGLARDEDAVGRGLQGQGVLGDHLQVEGGEGVGVIIAVQRARVEQLVGEEVATRAERTGGAARRTQPQGGERELVGGRERQERL